MLGAPLLREGTPIGVLLLGRKDVRPFTQSHIDLIGTFADQAVIAIETVRLLNDLQLRTDDLSESLEQQTATSDVLKVISSSTGDMKPVFETMLANALRICEAKFGHLLLYDGECFQGTHLTSPACLSCVLGTAWTHTPKSKHCHWPARAQQTGRAYP